MEERAYVRYLRCINALLHLVRDDVDGMVGAAFGISSRSDRQDWLRFSTAAEIKTARMVLTINGRGKRRQDRAHFLKREWFGEIPAWRLPRTVVPQSANGQGGLLAGYG